MAFTHNWRYLGLDGGSKESKFIRYLEPLEAKFTRNKEIGPTLVNHGSASHLPGPSAPPPPADFWEISQLESLICSHNLHRECQSRVRSIELIGQAVRCQSNRSSSSSERDERRKPREKRHSRSADHIDPPRSTTD